MPNPWNRCFIALAPDAESRETLANLPVPDAARRVAYDDLHLTLAFLGAIQAPQGHALNDALHVLAEPLPALDFQGLALWPSAHHPRVLVARYALAPALRDMLKGVHGVLRDLDVPIEARPFQPHVTLARLRPDGPPLAAESLALMESLHGVPPLHLETLGMYASQPVENGPRYRALEVVPLVPDFA